MSEHRHVPEPGELVYTPRPSWAPAFLAVGLMAAIAGIYAGGFIFSSFIYSIVGGIVAICAFVSLVKGGTRGYFGLSRKQHVRSSALPVETIIPPRS